VQNPEEEDIVVTRKSKRQMCTLSMTPRTIEEAYSSLDDADCWKEAVQIEIDSVMSNGT